jgi:hypothetical protein
VVEDPRLTRLREICAALPEAAGEQQGRHVGFAVRGRRFAWYLDDHHGDGRIALVCKAGPGMTEGLAAAEPARYFVPAYVGARGWVGLRLDVGEVDWDEVGGLLTESYRLVAPKRLVREVG